MQGTNKSGCPERRIQSVGFLQHTRVEGLDGVEARTGFIVSFDSLQIKFHQAAAGDSVGLKSCVDIIYRRL